MGGMTRAYAQEKGPARGPNFGCAGGGRGSRPQPTDLPIKRPHACGDPQSFWKQVELSLGLGAVPAASFYVADLVAKQPSLFMPLLIMPESVITCASRATLLTTMGIT